VSEDSYSVLNIIINKSLKKERQMINVSNVVEKKGSWLILVAMLISTAIVKTVSRAPKIL
jgi:TRAP-type mannitol/chloroaromatic compound transport system permease small subunit